MAARATPFAVLALVLPLLAILSPSATVPALLVACLWAAVIDRRDWRDWPRPPIWAIGLLALLLAWSAIASSWTYDPGRAALLSLRLALLYGAGGLLWSLAERLTGPDREKVAAALAIGLTLAILFLLEERLFDTPLFNLQGGPAADRYAQLSRFNRGVTAVALLIWPVVGWLWQRHLGAWALTLPLLLLLFLLSFESSAALLGLASALAVVLFGLLDRRLSRLLVLLAVIGALFLSPFVAALMAEAGWHEAAWLNRTAAQRVFMWGFTAERIFEQPLWGWGFDASRNMPNMDVNTPLNKDIIRLHPHNAALQILLELGYVGAVLAALFLGRLVLTLGRATRIAEICGQGLFVTALGVALTAYGLWQTKWQALLVLALVLYTAICRPRDAD